MFQAPLLSFQPGNQPLFRTLTNRQGANSMCSLQIVGTGCQSNTLLVNFTSKNAASLQTDLWDAWSEASLAITAGYQPSATTLDTSNPI